MELREDQEKGYIDGNNSFEQEKNDYGTPLVDHFNEQNGASACGGGSNVEKTRYPEIQEEQGQDVSRISIFPSSTSTQHLKDLSCPTETSSLKYGYLNKYGSKHQVFKRRLTFVDAFILRSPV